MQTNVYCILSAEYISDRIFFKKTGQFYDMMTK